MSIQRLKELQNQSKENESTSLSRINNKETVLVQIKSDVNFLWYYNERFLLHSFFVDENILLAKQHCYTCGLLDEYAINKFDSRILDYGIDHISYAMLSDNKELIQRYANLSHTHYMELVENGQSTPMYAIQCIIKEDWEQLKWALDILDKKRLAKNKTLMPDREFYEGMMNSDKQQIEKALAQLIKDHKKRNKNKELINEFVSHPALGYAKLAWLKGVEVEVNSPLVPKELLSVKPLDNYEIPYEFLK
jgi:hypothetical protein